MRANVRSLAMCLMTAMSFTCAAEAGPLNPPPGPVASTGSVMIFELPYTISNPGSYKLARDCVGAGGITVSADNVAIDLSGHLIAGVSTSSGVAISSTGTNLTVRGGTIRGWRQAITCVGSARLEKLDIAGGDINSSASPVIAAGPGSRLVDCSLNTANDVATLGDGSLVTGCTGASGGYYGNLRVGSKSVVTDCAFQSMTIWANAGSTVVRCSVRGYFPSAPNSVSTPIKVEAGSTVVECTVSGPLNTGIWTGPECIVDSCVVTGEVPSILAPGVFAISAGAGSSIRDCRVAVTGAQSQGIAVPNNGEVRGCTVSAGGTAIVASANGATIDSNTITNTPIAISITGQGNRVIRNSIRSATTAISALAGNDVGPVGTAAAATSPWANLAH